MSFKCSSDSNSFPFRKIADRLIDWYVINKRDLPWRKTKNPYPVWISEIILQQTRINQGMDYYFRFLEKFPDLKSLAEASEEQVLKAWQGLGYYSRARNLHQAARQIMEEYQGRFPDTYTEILKLKGIGPYTAAAIASISFRQPYPVLDGNVTRFLSRLFRIHEPGSTAAAKKSLYGKARLLMQDQQPGDFNQALMEFGALVCKPAGPLCNQCPFREECLAFRYGETGLLPVRSRLPDRRNRYFHYLVIIMPVAGLKRRLILRKREEKDIWRNLYDFPLIETTHPGILKDIPEKSDWKGLLSQLTGSRPEITREYRHILSHQEIHYRFYIYTIGKKVHSGFPVAETDHLENYPMPRPVEKFLKDILNKKEKKTGD